MTDTPRTEEELLAIFEECQTHGISSQDMRDFVVSIPGLAGGGGVPAMRFFSSEGGLAVPDSAKTLPDYYASRYDPHSLMPTGSYVSTSQSLTYTQGSWWRLPPGVWIGTLTTTWDSDTSGTARTGLLDIIDSRLDDEGYDAYIGNPGYAFGAPFGRTSEAPTKMHLSGANLGARVATLLTISEAMCDTVDAAVGIYYWQDSGSPRTVTTSDVNLWRIGPWNAGPED